MTDQDTNDQTTTVSDLKNLVQQFVCDRQWQRFHSPKNLSMALAVEASELMEIFQWVDGEASRDIDELDCRQEVAEELCDVICYCLAFANAADIDIASSFVNKMEKNRQKYPIGCTEHQK